MEKLINLGFAHRNRNFEPTHILLSKLRPNLITLELSVLEAKRHLQYISGKESELEAGYVFAKEKNLPLYAIDSLYAIESDFAVDPPDLKELSSSEVIKHNLTRIKKNPLEIYPEYKDYFKRYMRMTNTVQKRNEFMARALDLLAQSYPQSLIVHIGGASHVIPTDSENAVPIHKLTKQFDEVSGIILFQKFFTKESFWADRIDKKIKKRLKRENGWSPLEHDLKCVKRGYVF